MKKKRRILMFLLAVVFLVSGGMMIRQQFQYRKIIADSNEAAQIAGLHESTEPQLPASTLPEAGEQVPPLEPLPEEALDLASIGLEALRTVNEDVVGWIAIPNTELSANAEGGQSVLLVP